MSRLNNYVLKKYVIGKHYKRVAYSLYSAMLNAKRTSERWRRVCGKSLRQSFAVFKIWLTRVLIPPREMSLKLIDLAQYAA